ncbi:MAG: flagellar biosynthesis protein FlhB [bacterium]
MFPCCKASKEQPSRGCTPSVTKKHSSPGLPVSRSELDLQFFAAEDEGRTEDPTARQKNKAINEGNVARTEEFPSALIMGVGFLTIWLFGGWMFHEIKTFAEEMMGMERFSEINRGNLFNLFLQVIWIVGKVMIPVAVASMCATIVANVSQFGLLFTFEPLKLDFSVMSIDFSSFLSAGLDKDTLWNLGVAFTKIIVVGGAALEVIYTEFENLLLLVDMALMPGVIMVLQLGFEILLKAIIFLLILSPIDYYWQYYQWYDQLKMTPEQVEDEKKQQQGDPQVKEKQQEKMQEAAERRMMEEVPEADVVITNPTHFAVALQFEEASMQAPKIVAKGKDLTAQRIIKVAREHGVPIYEIPMLARALHQFELEAEIPQPLYEAVATVLAWVHENRDEVSREEAAMVEQTVMEEGFDVG